MKIFLDFDDVIFNTKEFVEDIKKIFRKNGVSDEIFSKYYYDYPQKGNVRKYNLTKHLARIKEKTGIESKSIREEIDNLIADTKKYLFKDLSLLFNLGNADLYLVSFSDTQFQKKKIKNSGIWKNFKRVFITNGPKSDFLERNMENKVSNKIFFLDDRTEHIDDVKKNFPEINTILMQRKEGRYKELPNKNCDFKAKNFKEVRKILDNA